MAAWVWVDSILRIMLPFLACFCNVPRYMTVHELSKSFSYSDQSTASREPYSMHK